MAKKAFVNIRGIDCDPGVEDRFIAWYDAGHIPDLMATGEVKKITRYEKTGDDKECPKHIIFIEFEDEEAFQRYEDKLKPKAAAGLQELKKAFPEGGMDFRWRVQYKAVRTWSE